MSHQNFDELILHAEAASFSGWDFSYLQGRWEEDSPSWDYEQMVRKLMLLSSAMLDMGTGGGEFLADLAPLPHLTCATEGYPPNLPVARSRLEPLGVQVLPVEHDTDLPFPDESFDLIINRHESFDAGEVFRILKPGGIFFTQQVGGQDCRRINELLEDEVRLLYPEWEAAYAIKQLLLAGFDILEWKEESPETRFMDIGALVYYLNAIPWQVQDFHVEKYRAKLAAIHQMITTAGSLKVLSERFYIMSRKPGLR